MLSSTSDRDKDQVVSRRAKKELRKAKTESQNSLQGSENVPEQHNILMVDQLWLWYIPGQSDSEPDTVITSFPSRKGVQVRRSGEVDDLQTTVLRSQNLHSRDLIHNTADLVSRILTVCCRTLDRHQHVKTVEFLQMFQNSIGDAVSLKSQRGEHIPN
jgi:hypothetical protein